jgi:hypothetical protein
MPASEGILSAQQTGDGEPSYDHFPHEAFPYWIYSAEGAEDRYEITPVLYEGIPHIVGWDVWCDSRDTERPKSLPSGIKKPRINRALPHLLPAPPGGHFPPRFPPPSNMEL